MATWRKANQLLRLIDVKNINENKLINGRRIIDSDEVNYFNEVNYYTEVNSSNLFCLNE